MVRTFITALGALVATLIFAPLTILFVAIAAKSRRVEWAITTWARWILASAGVDARVEGLEKLDPNGRYVFIANHYSYLDIPSIFATMPQSIRFMAKASLFKIPIFGWAIRSSGFIPIDRKDRSKAKASFDLAAERIRRGNCVLVFPEEGRSSHKWMRPFQRGAFLLAIRSELPIVPLAIDGTHEVLPVGSRRVRPGRVTIRVGDPIDSTRLSIREKKQLMEDARATIGRMLYGSDERYAEFERLAAEKRGRFYFAAQ
jgi:1-acyl-sn-glycerol-3-phosphate acyltransferase